MNIRRLVLALCISFQIVACGGSSEPEPTEPESTEPETTEPEGTDGIVLSDATDFSGTWYGIITPQTDLETSSSISFAYEVELQHTGSNGFVGTGRVLTLPDSDDYRYNRFDVRATWSEERLVIEQLAAAEGASELSGRSNESDLLQCVSTLELSLLDGSLDGTWSAPSCETLSVTLQRPPAETQRWYDNLPDCPCELTTDSDGVSVIDGVIVNDDLDREGTWNESSEAGDTLAFWEPYHPGASYELRWNPTLPFNPGQQCTYDEDRLLITGGLGAGTADLVSPGGLTNPILADHHSKVDVVPFKDDDPATRISCNTYLQRRPTNNGNSCNSNPVSALPAEASQQTCQELLDNDLIAIGPVDDGSGGDSPEPETIPGDGTELEPTTRSYTDPHFITHDGLRYDFHGVGEFVLVESTINGLWIHARHEPYRGTSTVASVTSGLGFDVNGDKVSIVRDAEGSAVLFIDDAMVSMGGESPLSSGGRIVVGDRSYRVFWKDGSNALVSDRGAFFNLSLALSNEHLSNVVGILGNYDGDPENDLMIRNGRTLTTTPQAAVLYGEFSESWRVTNRETSLLHYFPGQEPEEFIDRLFPKTLFNQDNVEDPARLEFARSVCLAQDVGDLLDECIMDIYLLDDDSLADDIAQGSASAEESLDQSNQSMTVELQGELPDFENNPLLLEFLDDLEGTYSGGVYLEGAEFDDEPSYSAEIVFLRESQFVFSAQSNYPELGCTGALSNFRIGVENHLFVFTETLVEEGTCRNKSEISVIPGRRLLTGEPGVNVFWYNPSSGLGSDDIYAFGALLQN